MNSAPQILFPSKSVMDRRSGLVSFVPGSDDGKRMGERSGRLGMGRAFEGLGRFIVVGRVVDDVWNGEWDIFHSHPAWATMGLFGWGLIGYEEGGKGYRGSLGCGGCQRLGASGGTKLCTSLGPWVMGLVLRGAVSDVRCWS